MAMEGMTALGRRERLREFTRLGRGEIRRDQEADDIDNRGGDIGDGRFVDA
jgi:hypothetical protein